MCEYLTLLLSNVLKKNHVFLSMSTIIDHPWIIIPSSVFNFLFFPYI